MLKLKLQYFVHLMWRADSFEKHWCWEILKVGGEVDNRGWDGWMASPTQCTWVWARSGRWWWTGKPGVMQSMGLQRVGHYWATELNWTDGCVFYQYSDIGTSSSLQYLVFSYTTSEYLSEINPHSCPSGFVHKDIHRSIVCFSWVSKAIWMPMAEERMSKIQLNTWSTNAARRRNRLILTA